MKGYEIIKRYILLTAGLFFAGLGVAFTKHAELGVSPISSVANVMNYKFPSVSMGTWLIIWNCCLIVGQMIVLGRKFKLIQLLQIPLSFLFGWFTDFGMWILSFIPTDIYPIRIIFVFTGVAILGFGISLAVIANVIMNSGEAFVKALSDTLHKEFGNVKIAFDIFCVVFSIILSLIFFDFKIVGAREGTVISALCTGIAVKFFNKRLRKPIEKILLQ